MPGIPVCVARSDLCRDAYRYAADAHGSEAEGGTAFGHPLAVAELLDRESFGEEVVAAALLHDVVEDTGHGLEEIRERFGAGVHALVAAMTEDERIERYEERKAEHRGRVLAASRESAAIYAADKLARVRAMSAGSEPAEDRRLAHYRATLELFAAERPDLPFLDRLAAELPALESAESGSGSG